MDVKNDKTLYSQQSLLGSMLISPEICGAVFQRVKADDFGDKWCREAFKQLRVMFYGNEPVDPAVLASRLGDGATPFLADLMRMTPTAANWEAYADIVEDSGKLRQLQAVAMQIVTAPDLDCARKALAQVDRVVIKPRIRVASYSDSLGRLLDYLGDPTPPQYIDWGIPTINDTVQVAAGDYMIIGADSSVGKTAIMLQLALNAAKSGKRVCIFSLETTERKLLMRSVAQNTGVNFQAMKNKRLSKDDYSRIMDYGEKTSRLVCDVAEASGATIDDIRAVAVANRYDIVMLDYLQIANAEGGSRPEIVTNISIQLRTLAQSLGVTVVALSQLTPPDNQAKLRNAPIIPNVEMLRESRQLKQDADIILLMGLVKPGDRASDRIVVIDKNKDGPCGQLYLSFDPAHMRFDPVSDAMSRKYWEAQQKALKAAALKKRAGQITFEELPDNGDELPF